MEGGIVWTMYKVKGGIAASYFWIYYLSCLSLSVETKLQIWSYVKLLLLST